MTSDVATTDPQHDARKGLRRRVLKAGVIAYNNRHSTLHCTVRDMSDGGARLLLGGSVNAPDTFELLIELDGLEAECQVVARSAGEVRVKFVAPVRTVTARRSQVLKAVVPEKPTSLRRKPRPSSG